MAIADAIAREFPPTETGLHDEARARFFAKVAVVDDGASCWMWTGAIGHSRGASRSGYGIFNLRAQDGFRSVGAHRVAREMATGVAVSADMEVMHGCDVKQCVRPSHLSIGTHADNMRDSALRNRHVKRIDDDTVRAIAASEGRCRDIGARFGVSDGYVSQIRKGTVRPYVERPVHQPLPPFVPDPTMDRNDAIVAAREYGETLEVIGDRYGITRERVRQIVAARSAVRTRKAA